MRLSHFVEQAVFVFGSNRQGIHGAGAALFALRYRAAQTGQGEGFAGQSYALPTKHTPNDAAPDFALLQESVVRFLKFAQVRPWLSFMVTRVGCGLAGFADAEVAPLFAQASSNCYLPSLVHNTIVAWLLNLKARGLRGEFGQSGSGCSQVVA